MSCVNCDPLKISERDCGLCRPVTSASGAIGTLNTSSGHPTTDFAGVDTDPERTGTYPQQSPYYAIFADAIKMLHDDEGAPDGSPLMHVICQAAEFEYAERLLDDQSLIDEMVREIVH
jgi:hypothetical protein